MPLASLLCILLSFGSLSLTLAGPQSTISPSTNLWSVIPSCAQSCLETFIEHSFPTAVCPNQQDLDCLCTSDSSTGFTVGEGALQCVAASCGGEGEGALGNAYEVCLGVGNAKSMTHPTLTATLSISAAIVSSITVDPTTTSGAANSYTSSTLICTSASGTESSSSYSSLTSLPSSVQTSIGSSLSFSLPASITTASGSPSVPTSFPTIPPSSLISQTSFITMSTKTSSTPSTSLEATVSSSASSALTHGLTKPQIAGVVVASVATAAIGFAILGFLLCIKRRRERKRESGSSFGCECGKETPIQPGLIAGGPNGAKRQTNSASEKAQRLLGVPSRRNENRWSLRRKILQLEDINGAKAPSFAYDTTQEPSPTSFASYRTTSRLLPDKPSLPLFPLTSPRTPSRRPLSAVARSAEGAPPSLIPPPPPPKPTQQGQTPRDGSQAALRQCSESRHPTLRDPFVESSRDPRAMMYAMERKRAVRPQLPRIITPSTLYNQGNSATIISNPMLPQHPPPIWPPPECRWEGVLPLSVSNQHRRPENPSARAINQDEYMVRPLYQSYHPDFPTLLHPINSGSSSRRTSGRRPVTHLTMSSDDTNFDDVEEILDIPGRSSFLSPVVEVRTPLSAIRYPAVPGTAASIAERRLSPTSPTRKPPRRQQYPQPLHINKSSNGKDKARPQRPERPLRTDSLLAKRRGPQEAAALMQDLRQGRNLNADMKGSNEDIRGSAEWKILCSPGIEGIEKSVSPRTPRSNRSNQRAPTGSSRR